MSRYHKGGRAFRRLRAIVLARDLWQCRIEECVCPYGRTIDRALRWPASWSATVDHIVPVSEGGPEYEVANLRAAHAKCNIRRGNVRRYAPPNRTSREW